MVNRIRNGEEPSPAPQESLTFHAFRMPEDLLAEIKGLARAREVIPERLFIDILRKAVQVELRREAKRSKSQR